MNFEELKARAEHRQKERLEKQALRQRKVPRRKRPIRYECRPNGEPTTLALENFSVNDYRQVFWAEAKKFNVRDVTENPNLLRDNKHMERFLQRLEEIAVSRGFADMAPRAKYKAVQWAASAVIRYRKATQTKGPAGIWMLDTFSDQFATDFIRIHGIWERTSLRFIMDEDIDINAITIEEDGMQYTLILGDKELTMHRTQLDQLVSNEQLRKRVGLAPLCAPSFADQTQPGSGDGTEINI